MLHDGFILYSLPSVLEERLSFVILLSLVKCLEHGSEEHRSQLGILHDHYYNPNIVHSLRI